MGDKCAPSLDNMSPEAAFDAGYSAAVEEMMEIVVMEMMPGGDPIEADIGSSGCNC